MNLMEAILTPPVAFVLYIALAGALFAFGRKLAGPGSDSPLKRTLYSSGEEAPTAQAVPGYRPFFVIALFFAILHLGVLVLASGQASPVVLIFLAGLMLTLLALILG